MVAPSRKKVVAYAEPGVVVIRTRVYLNQGTFEGNKSA
jgi:hypothetical protein